MPRLAPVLLVAASACTSYDSIDDACPKNIRGDHLLSEGTADFVERISCYRRYVDLAPLAIQYGVQQATHAHTTYLEHNGILDPASPEYDPTGAGVFLEREELPYATGTDVYTRLQRARAVDSTASIGVWQAYLGPVDDLQPDEFMHSPFFRDVAFQPVIIGAGWSEFQVAHTAHGFFTLVYTFPPNVRVVHPVVFPRDGQTNVPTGYRPQPTPDNPLAVDLVIGYPISVTVGSGEGELARENPYNLSVLEHTLFRVDQGVGEVPETRTPVDSVMALPRHYAWGDTQATVSFAASAPLQPATIYELEAVLTWNANLEERVRTRFTTAAEPSIVGDAPF